MFWIILLIIFTIISICLYYYRTKLKRQVTTKNQINKGNKISDGFENINDNMDKRENIHNNSNNKLVEKIDEDSNVNNNKSNDTAENLEVINKIQQEIDNINKDIIKKKK